jgi:hypothetical protein
MKVQNPFTSCGVFLHASIEIWFRPVTGIHVQASPVFNVFPIYTRPEFLVHL